jgi:hypothetical protein
MYTHRDASVKGRKALSLSIEREGGREGGRKGERERERVRERERGTRSVCVYTSLYIGEAEKGRKGRNVDTQVTRKPREDAHLTHTHLSNA